MSLGNVEQIRQNICDEIVHELDLGMGTLRNGIWIELPQSQRLGFFNLVRVFIAEMMQGKGTRNMHL